jgi:hypothetical protein
LLKRVPYRSRQFKMESTLWVAAAVGCDSSGTQEGEHLSLEAGTWGLMRDSRARWLSVCVKCDNQS